MKKEAISNLEITIIGIIILSLSVFIPIIVVHLDAKNSTKQNIHGICDCYVGAKSSPHCLVENSPDNHTICTFKANNPDTSNYFISLVGGGAGGRLDLYNRSFKGGAKGEKKELFYPAMQGYYCIRIGNGGNSHDNGEETIIAEFKNLNKDPKCRTLNYKEEINSKNLLEYANGGISTFETTNYPSLKEGEKHSNVFLFGKGGNSGKNNLICYKKTKNGICNSIINDGEAICDKKNTCKTPTIKGNPGKVSIKW